MIPRNLARMMLGTAATVATMATVAAVGGSVARAKGFTDPELFVTLPASIAKHTVFPSPTPDFNCPNRKELHAHCSNANWFDKLTIPPVNNALHHHGVGLTKEALHALRSDMDHSSQMSFDDPLHKKAKDYRHQVTTQGNIVEAFTKAGEHEGAVLHNILSGAFEIRANLAEMALHVTNGPGL